MTIIALDPTHPDWLTLADYAQSCSWRAGASLAQAMRSGSFQPWERVFAALDGETIAGYCTLAERDCLEDVPYSPYIGYVFVDEAYRGQRLSQRLIESALAYAGTLGFEKVYLVSDLQGLYEKYGFIPIDARPAPWNPNEMETIFMRAISF